MFIQAIITGKLGDLSTVFWENLAEMRNFPNLFATAESEDH